MLIRLPKSKNFIPAVFPAYTENIQGPNNDRILINEYGEFYNSETKHYFFGSNGVRYNSIAFSDFYDRSLVYTFNIHAIVAYTFLGKPSDSKLEVNHKDGNRKNNHVSNLEWITHRANIQHAIDTGLMPITGCAKDRRKCKAKHCDSDEWIYANSFGELGRKLGVSYKALHKAANNNRVTTSGYIVKYVDD